MKIAIRSDKCFGVAGVARKMFWCSGVCVLGGGVWGVSPPFEGATSTPGAAGDEIGVGTIAGDRGLSRAVVVVVVVVVCPLRGELVPAR